MHTIQTTIMNQDGSKRIINHSDAILPDMKNGRPQGLTVREKIVDLAHSLGRPVSIVTVRGNEVLVNENYKTNVA